MKPTLLHKVTNVSNDMKAPSRSTTFKSAGGPAMGRRSPEKHNNHNRISLPPEFRETANNNQRYSFEGANTSKSAGRKNKREANGFLSPNSHSTANDYSILRVGTLRRRETVIRHAQKK